jgi:hypothetical protein
MGPCGVLHASATRLRAIHTTRLESRHQHRPHRVYAVSRSLPLALRSFLANERTFLAWMRTTCSMFGLAISTINVGDGESHLWCVSARPVICLPS